MAVSIAAILDLALAGVCVALSSKVMTSLVVLMALTSMVTFAVAIGARSERALFASVIALATACAIADLPVHRSDAVVFAAVAGAAVLVFAEAGGAALEPKGGGTHVGHPASLHMLWVSLVAVGGAVAGWLLLTLRADLAGLGLAAVGVGVLSAICLVALSAVLASAAITERRRE